MAGLNYHGLSAGSHTITVEVIDSKYYKGIASVDIFVVEPFTFAHLTDVHIGYTVDDLTRMRNSITQYTDTIEMINKEQPKFVIITGDIVDWDNENFYKLM